MATATRKNPAPAPARADEAKGEPKAGGSLVVRAFDAVFRFLASLKLAVICLATLSATLAFGTWFNSAHGLTAANEWIYSTKWFALLLAFLGMNILCAALIRYPWTKRQTGFLITHAGLLIVIGGSWWAAQGFDEGLLGLLEGQESSKLVRTQKPAIYVRPIDPHSGRPLGEYNLPFRSGSFDWPSGRYEVLSEPKDPFKLAVKKFYAASRPRTIFVPDPAGSPMAKIRPRLKPPRSDAFMDAFPSEEDRWFVPPTSTIGRIVKDLRTAQFIFAYNESHENFDDFLDPPADPGKEGVARLRYEDKDGKPRFVDVRLDDARPGQPIALPDSDLTASFLKLDHTPMSDPKIRSMTGEDELHIAHFNVKRGSGPEIEHSGYALLPTIPAVIPKRGEPAAEAPRPLIQINYYLPPLVDPQVNGRYGVVEVMGDDHGRLAYRVFGRGTPGKLGPHGLLKVGEEVTAFGGNELAPMTMKFSVEEFLQHGKEEQIAEPLVMPVNKKDEGIPAALVELTVHGVTKEAWLRKSHTLDPAYSTVTFPDGVYELSLDSDRLDLGFSLKLEDFDVGFDPGTQQASSFRSEVKLTDEAQGIKDKPVSIFMNNTLDHRGWRFFQSSYQRHEDPRTGRPTGQFISVFQVARNPARELIYFGCMIVVLGAFVQFYMRAGIFTDGGKLQQHRAAEKARKRLEAKMGKTSTSPPPTSTPAETEADEPL
jgi:hypothetical protein